jgi:hypothetical protein
MLNLKLKFYWCVNYLTTINYKMNKYSKSPVKLRSNDIYGEDENLILL